MTSCACSGLHDKAGCPEGGEAWRHGTMGKGSAVHADHSCLNLFL